MRRVMLDNWFLMEAIRYLQNPAVQSPRAYGELLSALVLWDEVCYPDNDRSRWQELYTPLSDVLVPIDDRENACSDASVDLMIDLMRDEPFPDPYFLWLRDPEHVVNARALRYQLLSAAHGCDYLPSTRRQAFLRQREDPRQIQALLLRHRMQALLDEKAAAYYKEAYGALLEIPELKLSMPVLADYIVQNAPEGMEPLEYALHLKQEGSVIQYRDYLRQLEEAMEHGEWKRFRQLLRASQELMEQVIHQDEKRLRGVTVKLLPTPSVAVNYGCFRGELSVKPTLSFEPHLGRRMHLSFLRELTDFAINERRII